MQPSLTSGRDEPEAGSEGHEPAEKLSALKQLRLGVARQYYAMTGVLGLKRVQDYLQGASPLLAAAGTVWVLGERYECTAKSQEVEEEVTSEILQDVTSRLWMTYRKGFPPLGPADLTSDVGWGCTLRSGQMLLAQGLKLLSKLLRRNIQSCIGQSARAAALQVLLQHIHGRRWRRSGVPQQHSELAQLLAWFWDSPASGHPFSIHSLVAAGKLHGVVAGQWLGPWTLCHTLQQAVNEVHPAGLIVHLANTPGGGAAPVLYTQSALDAFATPSRSEAAALQPGLLLLVPLVLGIGKVNPVYVPQLQAVLRWPQSAGIVGGRPSSSLYFIGYQDSQVMFLDPHHVQEVGSAPVDVAESYFCDAPRMMPFTSIDPSLAIAFYCRSTDSFEDLMERLRGLESEAGSAPLLNVVEGVPPPPFVERMSSLDDGGAHGEEQWELLHVSDDSL